MKLNLGCGTLKKEGYVNVDYNADVHPDVVHDLNVVPFPFEDNSVDWIESIMVLEHLSIHPQDFFGEIYRILKPNGKMRFSLPNFYCIQNRIHFLFGRPHEFIEGWHPWHTKIIKPSFLANLLRHRGFAVEHKMLLEFRRTIDFTIRKRP